MMLDYTYMNKAKLLSSKIISINKSLVDIADEIKKYNEEITEKRNDLTRKIKKADKTTINACAAAVGFGALATFVGIAAAPVTGGASLLVAEAAIEVSLYTR
jgi:hypothetical protein